MCEALEYIRPIDVICMITLYVLGTIYLFKIAGITATMFAGWVLRKIGDL